MSILELVSATGVVPVVVVDDVQQAVRLGDALADGGMPLIEVTLRTAAARGAIRALAEQGRLAVGAGSVRTVAQVDDVVDLGARFIVSPGFSAAVVARARELGVPIIPGVATASEAMAALDAGVHTVKFFPAEQLGGTAGLRALGAPFPELRFVPTGGIGPDKLADYLAIPQVLAVGGSWMAERTLVEQGGWDEITRRTSAAVSAAADRTAGDRTARA